MGFNLKKNIKIAFFFVVCSLSHIYSGTDGTIRGKILDVEGQPITGAQIFIADLGLGAISDADGNYILLNIPVGNYDVTVQMIGYKIKVIESVDIVMDETVWLNTNLSVSVLEGETVFVTGEKGLVEKGTTSKKVTVGKEAIESLPIREITELYSLQSGVVKVESRSQGIPDHEVRGLEEVHVKGGRAGEIAYMIDGMYIRNPIFGGIGSRTNLNLFAVSEFDWQPGGFNAEYGDAMSAISNLHTSSGGKEYSWKYKFETSRVGAGLKNEYDMLRGYDDINVAFGGPMPLIKKFHFWTSGRFSNYDAYQVYEFDDNVYINDPEDLFNAANVEHNLGILAQPYDTIAGFRAFGAEEVKDIFIKLNYSPASKLRFNFSYWALENQRKGFDTKYLYWNAGQNELFRDTERYFFDMSHSLTPRTFYTIRASRFQQDMFLGVRLEDSDNDGYPDWFEWRHTAGDRESSDPYNSNIIPYQPVDGDSMVYIEKDPYTGWYYGQDPGLYNWEVAEDFTDINGNGVYDQGEDFTDLDEDGIWDGPEKIEDCLYRDGSYWLLPEMYVDFVDFVDDDAWYKDFYFDPFNVAFSEPPASGQQFFLKQFGLWDSGLDPFYYLPFLGGGYGWAEGQVFGGTDRFYTTSQAITDEIRFDMTSQLMDKWKARVGVDYKTHKLQYYEQRFPFGEDADEPRIQRFSEYWLDTGPDGLLDGDPGDGEYQVGEPYTDQNNNNQWDENEPWDDSIQADQGEGNEIWDEGEEWDDVNGNGKWDDFREPKEFSSYWQNTFEVPWMVVNAGIRMDGVNYNTQVWADLNGDPSPNKPWYYYDIGDSTNNYVGANDNKYSEGEPVGDIPLAYSNQRILFTEDIRWYWKVSPRLGISHVITDQSTFTFNYGVYYQTPTYQSVYLNTNRQADPQDLFESSDQSVIGNSTMLPSRTQSYEAAFNVQLNPNFAYSLALWVKDMDQMVTAKRQRSGIYAYDVFDNGDYGSAKGIDLTLESRTQIFNALMQYTYSVAKANSEYDWAKIGNLAYNAPSQEYLMTFDRTHDLTLSLYTSKLPFGINAGLTGFYQSGAPYTPLIPDGDSWKEDEFNKNSQRSPSYQNINLSFSKYLRIGKTKLALGLNVFNVFDIRNPIDIYQLTGNADTPGEYYLRNVGVPYSGLFVTQDASYVEGDTFELTDMADYIVPDYDRAHSGGYYDKPWMFSKPREINFFVRFDFN